MVPARQGEGGGYACRSKTLFDIVVLVGGFLLPSKCGFQRWSEAEMVMGVWGLQSNRCYMEQVEMGRGASKLVRCARRKKVARD